ncbi:MAG: exodeoxyribonuclease VII small subunit [Prevotella sp.]|nr:exodeoxyribonuclease VII small subunit [Prevotella sp.]
MAEQNNMKYEDAMKRLEELVQQMESGDVSIDSLTQKLKEAKQLIQLCKDKLTKTEEEIKKVQSD